MIKLFVFQTNHTKPVLQFTVKRGQNIFGLTRAIRDMVVYDRIELNNGTQTVRLPGNNAYRR